MMTAEELAEIDNWRFARHIATRSDAIRRAARNGVWVENDVADLAERTEVIYDEIYAKYIEVRQWVSWFEDDRQTEAPPLTPLEVLDRVSWWLQGILDDAERLDIQALALNNRLVGAATAPHDRGSRVARRRAMAEAEKRREEYLERTKEFASNQAIAWVHENMSDEERAIYDQMTDDEQEAYLDTKLSQAPKIDPFERSWLPETIYDRRRKEALRLAQERREQIEAAKGEPARREAKTDERS